jgi:hypothetical protein
LINLSLPASDAKSYALFGDFLIGPFSPIGQSSATSISYRSAFDFIRTQSGHRYHEHNVEHSKQEGEFSFIPTYADIIDAPTITYPKRITFDCFAKSTGKRTSLAVNNGLWGPQVTSRVLISGTTSYLNQFCTGGTMSPARYYRITPRQGTLPTTPVAITWEQLMFVGIRGNTLVFHTYTKTSNVYLRSYYTDYSQFNPSDLPRMFEEGSIGKLVDGGETSLPLYEAASAVSFSLESFQQQLAIRYMNSGLEEVPSLPDISYGDLAMEASAKVNRNHVNMIAFLKDLRKPKEMIPKLLNLNKLKTHAGNFLAINYGILPTLSDLQAIWEAYKRILPYIDKNGFKTYNAVRSSSLSQGVHTLTLEQRIKIAIEDEDSEFVALGNKVDSMGFALTLENVWDLIPYSFVVDWFINVGGFLERVDSRMRLLFQNIRYATMSRKETMVTSFTPSKEFPYSGTLSTVHYQRWTDDHCPVPPLFSQNTPTVSDHWLEASALIIQRTKY